MLKSIAFTLAACAALVFPSTDVRAGSELDGLVQVEVLDGGMTRDGTYMTALRLTLSQGWKTYWRAPGDAGIPPSFNWRGSRNVGAVAITWPEPEVFLTNGLRTIGYSNELVLPVEVTPSKDGTPVRLKGRMDIGLCSDVCIPGSVDFDHRLDAGAGRNPAIVAAMAQRPYTASEAGVKSTTCTLSPTPDGMRVEARITMPSAGGTEIAVIEPGDPRLWAAESATHRAGNVLVTSTELIRDTGGSFAIDRSQIRITVLGKSHSVDIRGCSAG
ncbi:protein-disulfide reductase DsbD domain-containing protein [Phaeobacter marinintestinus]|uniref:protein-disulfide reductase DsbD domain-containing protein n=1 Tax=Falsiphaeobacter marinintestinus TaxID=1492905 RepID=UPI0011B5FAB7|nr:protein-disulfide reductase DsbD domain-containing protein [Phaeobacter marinintestinus]